MSLCLGTNPIEGKYGCMTKQTTGKWEDISPLLTGPKYLEKDPEKVCSRITEIISDAMDLHILSKIIIKCRRASRKKRKIFRQLRKNNNRANKEKFKKARQTYNKVEKEAKRKYNTKLKEDLTNSNLSSKKWWQVVNSLAGKAAHSSIPCMMMLPISQPGKRPTYFAKHSQRSAIFRMQTLLPHILLINLQFHLLTTSSLSL